MAAHYSVQLSHNVARGMEARAHNGLPLGDIPFGYRTVNPVEPPGMVADEAEAVRKAFEKYAAGNCSMLEIADWLNSTGLRPRSKRGRLVFSKATVRGMLSNPTYVGDIARHGEVVGPGRHEPIVSRELWDKVQQVRERRAWRPQMYGARPSRPYLLSGVGFCADCGSPLWANTTSGGRHNYYRCASRSRGDECLSEGASCRAEIPEGDVSSLFARLELPLEWRERMRELVAEGSPVADLERERRRLLDKIARVQRGLVDGVLDNETAKAAVRGILPKPPFAPLFRVLAEEEGRLISVSVWRPRGDSNP